MTLHRFLALVALAVVLVAGASVAVYLHSGLRAYVVHTGSMEPTLDPGDLVLDRPVRSAVRPGDVITFQHSQGPDLVTHRVTAVGADGISTQGDANRTEDTWLIRPDQVHGVGVHRVPSLGYLVVFMGQPAGVAATMLSGLTLYLLWGLFFPAPRPRPALS